MASADKFYLSETLICPLCGRVLVGKPCQSDPERLKLVHPSSSCVRSKNAYYWPARDLTPIPKEFQ